MKSGKEIFEDNCVAVCMYIYFQIALKGLLFGEFVVR
jgi:hypothetical protein